MQKSLVASLEDAALDHKLVVRAAAADGVITPEELTRITASAEQMHRKSVSVHRAQRVGISMMRVGYAAPWIEQELGPESIEAIS